MKLRRCSCDSRREAEKGLRECEDRRDELLDILQQCSVENTECEQQTTDLKETLQEVENGTPNKDQQAQGSYSRHEERKVSGDHQEYDIEFVKDYFK